MTDHRLEPPFRQYRLDELDWVDIGSGWQRVSITLRRNELADNPASTKRSIFGPAEVTYERGPSGAITVHVEDPKEGGGAA